MDQHEREAYQLGVTTAENAASWCVDGNTDVGAAERTLAMIREGDPAAWDRLPREPNLSGEWADDPTPLSLAREVMGSDDPLAEDQDALADAFERGVSETFEAACEQVLISFVNER